VDDAVNKYRARRDERLRKRTDEFEENKHPRDENGQFKSSGGSKDRVKRPRMTKEELTNKIAEKLNKKWEEAGYRQNSFVLDMKSGNKITVTPKRGSVSRTSGRWYRGSGYFVVSGDGIDGEKYFKSLSSLAKSMAYGYIK